MKDFGKFLACLLGCMAVGVLSTPFTVAAIPTWYATLNKPFFSPPNWVFGPVWTVLYILMGISLFLIVRHGLSNKKIKIASIYFLAQLALNYIWTPIFFALKEPLLALFVIAAMWIVVLLTILKFYPLSKTAAYLLIPYLLWISFASVLNLSIVVLN